MAASLRSIIKFIDWIALFLLGIAFVVFVWLLELLRHPIYSTRCAVLEPSLNSFRHWVLHSTQFLVSSTPPAAQLFPLPSSHSTLVHIIKSNSIFIQFKSSGLRYKVSSLLSHWVHISSNWCWLRFQCFACFKRLIPTNFYLLCTSKCGSLESYLFFFN